ncbi:MAG: DNA-binding response regulator, partial [Lentisphaerae bacterium]|nr:DNA-binding response regulator [Lentisphaerota bacterium]
MAKIMMIDDDIGLAENTALLLTQAGHTVTMSDTVEGAIEKLT